MSTRQPAQQPSYLAAMSAAAAPVDGHPHLASAKLPFYLRKIKYLDLRHQRIHPGTQVAVYQILKAEF
jgi:hypothetical protein